MKLYNKFSIILIATFLLIFASCEETVTREPSPVQEGGTQAYFSEENSTSRLFLPADATVFAITVGRQNTQGRVTVQLLVNDKESVLVLNESVTFEEGQALAEIEVDFSAMELGQSTTLDLAIKEETDRYFYGLSTLSIKILRDYNWVDVGIAEFDDLVWTEEKADVLIQQAVGTELFRLVEPYSEVFLALDDTDPDIEKCRGKYLNFYLDTTFVTGADDKKYRSCNAVKLPSGVQDLGLGIYGYGFYWALPGEPYAGYCSFTNYGNIYTIEGIVSDLAGAPLASYPYIFTWKDGFPGEIPDPYKGEDIENANLNKEMTDAAGYYFGYEYFSYYTKDSYGSDSAVYVAEYIVEMESQDLLVSLNVLAFFDGNIAIPAGEYKINSSDDGYSVRVGSFTELPYGSFAEIPAVNSSLYFTSGTVKFEYSGNIATITVDAASAKGSTVKATWTGELAVVDLTGAPAGIKGKTGFQRPKRAKLSLIK
jgi:hypothetical protein